jgi:hypothetical protein
MVAILEPELVQKLKQIAERDNCTVEEALQQAVDFFVRPVFTPDDEPIGLLVSLALIQDYPMVTKNSPRSQEIIRHLDENA